MSFFKSIGSFLGKVAAPIGSLFGPVGTVLGGLAGGLLGSKGAPAVARMTGPIMAPRGNGSLTTIGQRTIPGGGGLAGLGGLGGIAGGALGGAVATKVIGNLMSDGSVQKKKRRRRKGISATELKNYDRVDNFLNKRFKCSTAKRISKR